MLAGMDVFEGAITGAAFSSGDAVVVGTWARSPLGSFVDVMWRRRDGTRVLLAPDERVAVYVSGLYVFDEISVLPIRGGIRADQVSVWAGTMALHARLAASDWRSWLFALRPRPLRRLPVWIRAEDVLARPFVGRLLGGGAGVRAAGLAPGGQQEYYGVDDWRRLATATLCIDGADAGDLTTLPADFGVGLSAFPTIPSSVRVGTLICRRKGDR